MKRQQQWLAALSLLGLLSATQAAVAADRGDEVAQPVVRKRGLMRDIIQVITEGGLPDPVTVLQTTTMLATVTVPAPDIAAAVINDTAAPVALGAAAPAAPAVVGAAAGVPAAACAGALTITQTVTVQSCLAGGIGAAAPIDTGVALAVPTAAPIAAAPGIDAAATGPRGGIGVQIVQLPQTAATTLVVPQAPPPPIQPILPPGSGIVEGSVAASLLPLPAATAAPANAGLNTLQPLPGAADTLAPLPGAANTLQPLPGAVDTLAPLPGAANTLQPLPGAANTLQPLPGAASTLQPLPGAADTLQPLPGAANTLQPLPGAANTLQPLPGAAPTPDPLAAPLAPPPAGVGEAAFGGSVGVIPASAALPVDPLAIPPPSPVGLAPTPVAGGNFGEVPAAAPPEAVITDAPTADTAVANAPLDINLDGLSLNSVLNLGNLVQQTISLQTPAAAASPVAEFRRWADDAE